MRPQHLKLLTEWKERKVFVHDQIWYIPGYGSDYGSFTFSGWEDPLFFGNAHPVYVEYCSGNGAWIASKAAAHPSVNWIAVEKRFERVRKIWSKTKNEQLNNLLTLFGEGFLATQHYFPEASVDQVYINFPDPWPKTRHHKHRLIQPAFIMEISRILKKEGHLVFTTDDVPYSEWFLEVMQAFSEFSSVFPSPGYVNELSDYGSSYFEDLWRDQGRSIRYHQFKKNHTRS